MKSIWKWLGTPMAAKIISILFFVTNVVSTLGKTGSYWAAFNTGIMFFAIWSLGQMTVKERNT